MATIKREISTVSPWVFDARQDLQAAIRPLVAPHELADGRIEISIGTRSLWILLIAEEGHGFALRAAYSPEGHLAVETIDENEGDQITVELGAPFGSIRVQLQLPSGRQPVRSTTRLIAAHGTAMPFWPRDLYAFGPDRDPGNTQGTVHTTQRGLRTGIVYASSGDVPLSVLYLQNFSGLSEYFELTHTSPADSVGGTWPEMGFSLPPTSDQHLPHSRDVTISDAFLASLPATPLDETRLATGYLDMVASIYQALPHPTPTFHDWVGRAADTARDLQHSPICSDERRGRRYLRAYVGDPQPPESMVQLTVLLALLEYGDWLGESQHLCEEIVESLENFYDPDLGSMVRWLPGERFVSKGEAQLDHDTMDSWYLYHTLANLGRLAERGDRNAFRLFRDSLPYAIRVARRFEYRWPIFFNLRTLDVIREESRPGVGGETDVAGLYALLMVRAFDILEDDVYLQEAIRAVDGLSGLDFNLGYQTNTVAFGVQALMRLRKITGDARYADLAHRCIANLMDNLWLWEGRYGFAKDYLTYFGIFPLLDAPYLAAYEEAELLSIFREVLITAGDELRGSARLLIGEYIRYSLDRAWYYYPDRLPASALASDVKNGHVARSLAVPLEDLQDGWQQSGTVGQEVYGAGISLTYAACQFIAVSPTTMLYCDYPVVDLKATSRGKRLHVSFRIAGDRKGRCDLRLVPRGSRPMSTGARLDRSTREGWVEQRSKTTDEGHTSFTARGQERFRLSLDG